MTFNWSRLTCPALAFRHAAPWARKTSATSRGGRATRPWSAGRRFLRQADAQPVQRALDVADRVDGDAGVERGRLELGVAQQHLDHANIDALFEQVGGEAVPQGMTRLEIPARSLAAVTARLSWRAVTGLIGFWPGNSQTCGRAAFHHSRRSWSSWGDSITSRSRCPLPCSTRSIMRSLSMSDTFRWATSDTLRPAP